MLEEGRIVCEDEANSIKASVIPQAFRRHSAGIPQAVVMIEGTQAHGLKINFHSRRRQDSGKTAARQRQDSGKTAAS